MTIESVTQRARQDGDAHDLLRRAHASTYRLPEGFPGFHAVLALSSGERGSVVVRSPAEVCLALNAPAEALRWVRGELTSMASHRWASSYAAGDGRWAASLAPEDGHPLGRAVRFEGDPFDSAYRLLGGRVTQIDRRMGRTRFSIVVQERVPTPDGRSVPTQFTVAHWSIEDGRLARADTYSDAYAAVDGVLLPASRRVVSAADGGLTARQLTLTDHEVLTDA